MASPIPWIWHAELQRTTVVLCVQFRSKVGLTLRTTEESQRKSTSTHHRLKIRSCAEFQRTLWAFARRLETAFLTMPGFPLKHARDVFGVKGRKPRQPWISHGTWCTVKVTAPLRRLANQAGESYFAAWMASKPCEFAPGDHLQGPGSGWKAYGTHQEWTRKAARFFYLASAL